MASLCLAKWGPSNPPPMDNRIKSRTGPPQMVSVLTRFREQYKTPPTFKRTTRLASLLAQAAHQQPGSRLRVAKKPRSKPGRRTTRRETPRQETRRQHRDVWRRLGIKY